MKSFSRVLHGVFCVAVLATASSASAGTYFDTVMADSPEGYWRLNDAGSPVLDATGNGHNGTIVNPGGVTLQDPGALYADPDTSMDFAGTNGRVQVPFDAALNPVSFTVELWAKVEGGSGHRSPLTGRTQLSPPGSGLTGERGYIFYATPGNTWEFWVGTGSTWQAQAGGAVRTGQWEHLVGTFVATSGPDANGIYTGTKWFYVNGVQVASTPNVSFLPSTTSNLHVGSGGNVGSEFFFNGDVDEVAVYGAPLTVAQIRRHWNVANSNYSARFDFANPGVGPAGLPLGLDASKLIFAGRTNASPTPTNPDGVLVLGGNGTGGMVFPDAVPLGLTFDRPLVIETEAYFLNADAPPGSANAYFGLKALHRMGDAGGATLEEQRRGGLFAQFEPRNTDLAGANDTGDLWLGYQTALASGNDLFTTPITLGVSGVPDANGRFNMQLSISGLADTDQILFLVSQGQWSAQLSRTVGQYRSSLPTGGIREAFDLVLSELRANPSLMQVGFLSTSARLDAYDYLQVFATVPEPSSVLLLGLGGVGLAALGWRRARRTAGPADRPAASLT